MIEVKNLTKKYGSFTAVKDVSFEIEKGHVYGLLGPNGAGKSTTMNIMTGCLAATEGTVTVNGYDIYENAAKAKSLIGYLPEMPPLYPDMTPYEYLTFVARAKKVKDAYGEVKRVCELCGITEVAGRLIKNLSKGYRQRVGVAQALVGDPECIILDEPTVGLDPAQLIGVRSLISSLKEDHAVILSSHIMGEVTAVCDYVIIMACGEIVAKGSLEELEGSRAGQTITVISRGDAEALADALRKIEGVEHVASYARGEDVKCVIETAEGYDLREDIFNAYVSLGCAVLEMTSSSVSLEDLFIRLTEEAASRRAEEEAEKEAAGRSDGTGYKAPDGYSPLGPAYLEDEEEDEEETAGEPEPETAGEPEPETVGEPEPEEKPEESADLSPEAKPKAAEMPEIPTDVELDIGTGGIDIGGGDEI